jgi:hypothetical protein
MGGYLAGSSFPPADTNIPLSSTEHAVPSATIVGSHFVQETR